MKGKNDNPDWHRAQLVRHARGLFQAGGVIEDALDTVMQAAREEFHCTVVIAKPALMVIDGGRFEWPEADRATRTSDGLNARP